MMLDRTQQPEALPINNIVIPPKKVVTAPNGVELHILDMGEQEVIRIDLMFGAGKWDQKKFMVAMMTNLLLKEGVEGMSSSEVADQLDFYGAWLHSSASFHNSYVTLYSLNKHIGSTLGILEKIVKKPLFPEHEFEVNRDRRKQQFVIENEKVTIKALNRSIDMLFGDNYPYGQHAPLEAFDKVTTEDLREFHRNYYNSGNCRILLTGRVTDEIVAQVTDLFGKEKWGGDMHRDEHNYEIVRSKEHYAFIEKKDAMQSAVRVALPVVGATHPDYSALRVLNAILGGYFGSRLMANIREEKGYTYGIGSSITTLKNASYLVISTQTATCYTREVVKEIFNEIEILKEELVDDEELSMLKGYLMGEMARLFDGPFSVADAYESLLANNLGLNYYTDMIDTIKNVSAQELRELARKYFVKENFYTVVAGQQTEE